MVIVVFILALVVLLGALALALTWPHVPGPLPGRLLAVLLAVIAFAVLVATWPALAGR